MPAAAAPPPHSAEQITFTGEWAREAQLRFEFVIDRPWTWRARVRSCESYRIPFALRPLTRDTDTF